MVLWKNAYYFYSAFSPVAYSSWPFWSQRQALVFLQSSGASPICHDRSSEWHLPDPFCTHQFLPPGSKDLNMSNLLTYSLTWYSSIKGKSTMLQAFPLCLDFLRLVLLVDLEIKEVFNTCVKGPLPHSAVDPYFPHLSHCHLGMYKNLSYCLLQPLKCNFRWPS